MNKNIIIISILVVLVMGFAISCSGPQLSGPNVFITGEISGATGEEKVIVVLYANENKIEDKNTVKVGTSVASNWRYNAPVKGGIYQVCAFIDENNDLKFSMGERYGCNPMLAEITKENTNDVRDVTIGK